MKSSNFFHGYLFDLDGTLVDSAPDLIATLNYILTKQSLPSIDFSLAKHWSGLGTSIILRKAFEHFNHPISENQLQYCIEDFLTYYSEHINDHSLLYPTVIKTLTTLKENNIPMAIVTNKLDTLTHKLLKKLNIDHFFNTIVCGNTRPHSKPHPEPALYACDTLNILPSTALFIGDSSVDINCAKEANIPIAYVSHGYDLFTTDLIPEFQIKTIEEILALSP